MFKLIYPKKEDYTMKLYLKIFSLIMTFALLFGAVACDTSGNNGGATSAPSDTLVTTEQTTDATTESTTSATTAATTAATTESTTAATTAPQSPDVTPEPEPQKIKNIIIIIGDGMGLEHIKAGEIGTGKNYQFTDWQQSVSNTDSVSSSGNLVLTDSAASATALATGNLTINGYVGQNIKKEDLPTILDLAKEKGKATGVLTTDAIHGATPGGFSGHSPDRNNDVLITMSQITSGVDFICGARNDNYYNGFKKYFDQNSYYYTNTISDKETILSKDKVFLPISIESGKDENVSLAEATELALEFLERDEDGFVLMIEQAYIDKYSHNNDFANMFNRVESLADTVDTVMEWIGDREDTAVIVTADHETGGLKVSDTNSDSKAAVYKGSENNVYYTWSSTGHTRTEVGIFVYGVDVDFAKISKYKTAAKIKNIDTFTLMKGILNGTIR